MWITSSTEAAKTPTNIALGNFDGVHLGHQRVMAQVLDRPGLDQVGFHRTDAAQVLSYQSVAELHGGAIAHGHSQLSNEPALENADKTPSKDVDAELGHSTVVTFLPHPQEYFSGVSRPLLTPINEKAWQLAQMGVQQLVMLPFNQAIAELSPEVFVKQILIDGLQAQQISVGNDFRFGKGRAGTAEGLEQIAEGYGVPVTRVALKEEKGDRISSSRIRQALQTGELAEATQLLGRPYILTGKVVKGQQIGRTIGFATANLQVPADKYLPRTGVYSVRVYGAISNTPSASVLDSTLGVMNIGHRPTVGGQSLSVEVHLLDWSGDLYGQMLTVSLETFVRPEQKFDSLMQLKAQIEKDCETAKLVPVPRGRQTTTS
ncbi:MAG: bifunctional riboflavin kinase/FAD synthetase [Leptolyngbya foveolarum]|uniref:Bifunctional riboflavin kinase/FMN adenylyltransferase n=1 Tax=Leptolyngbya foveolarum TaxID=47253 RepID=A0A2W4TQ47_9CYAN|nr:MAG: bifunctional riboflavin kinase/FAD synthetase [Leptolyngbya foveolarum]